MQKPLIVDLDYSLIKTDLTVESLMKYMRHEHVVGLIVFIYYWVFKSKNELKDLLASRVDLDIERLPYNQKVLDLIRDHKSQGYQVILASASHQKFVVQVAEHIGFFDECWASTKATNLKGKTKLKRIQESFGNEFSYIGDSRADIPIWEKATGSRYAVNLIDTQLQQKLRLVSISQSTKLNFLKLLRCHQWSKNVLLLVPLFAGHIFGVQAIVSASLGIIAFSLMASAGYLINDCMDLDADRKHIKKRFRPIPAGDIKIHHVLLLAILLVLMALGVAFTINKYFSMLLVVYLLTTLGYSIYFKKFMLVDVLFLSFFYSLRIYAGAAVVGISVSKWLLLFSMFFFMGLAFLKRFIELQALSHTGNSKVSGRGYLTGDTQVVSQMGISSGLVSVLVLCLYFTSADVKVLYANSDVLLLVAPFMVFYISRLWILGSRGVISHDPVEFSIKDRVSYVLFCLILAVFLLGIYAK